MCRTRTWGMTPISRRRGPRMKPPPEPRRPPTVPPRRPQKAQKSSCMVVHSMEASQTHSQLPRFRRSRLSRHSFAASHPNTLSATGSCSSSVSATISNLIDHKQIEGRSPVRRWQPSRKGCRPLNGSATFDRYESRVEQNKGEESVKKHTLRIWRNKNANQASTSTKIPFHLMLNINTSFNLSLMNGSWSQPQNQCITKGNEDTTRKVHGAYECWFLRLRKERLAFRVDFHYRRREYMLMHVGHFELAKRYLFSLSHTLFWIGLFSVFLFLHLHFPMWEEI